MKRYKLKIKDDKSKWNDYGLGIEHNAGMGCVGVTQRVFEWYSYNMLEEFAGVFTEGEVSRFPYGFVKQHELIEVE